MADKKNGGQEGNQGKGKGSTRGFASMDPEQQRAIARKGGEAVSQNREHMSAIGRKGGEASGGGRNNNNNGNSNNNNNNNGNNNR